MKPLTLEDVVQRLMDRVSAIEASLKLDRAIWDDYERRLDAHGASNLAAHTLIHDLQRQLSERPTWDDLRAVFEAVYGGMHSESDARYINSNDIYDARERVLEIAASRSVAKAPDEPPAAEPAPSSAAELRAEDNQ